MDSNMNLLNYETLLKSALETTGVPLITKFTIRDIGGGSYNLLISIPQLFGDAWRPICSSRGGVKLYRSYDGCIVDVRRLLIDRQGAIDFSIVPVLLDS